VEANNRLSVAVGHGPDPVRSSSLGCRCRLWHSAELEALVSLQVEEGLCLGADNHSGRHRDMDDDVASRDQTLEAVSVED
jgi:hypothetical protein